MRIALSGSHRTGKSALLAELASHLPQYETVDEPYHLLEEDGYDFSHPPSIEDFEEQLARSIEELVQAGEEVLFDRCPLDFLAYAEVHEEADRFDLEEWLPKIREAVATLDLVIFVPIEEPDRVDFAESDDEGGSRARVDETLREILLDDPYDLGLEVVEVTGDPERRVQTVLRWLRRGAP